MNKAEALAVLHEIFDSCKEGVLMSYVSLDPAMSSIKKTDEDYQIRMKCDLDNCSREYIKPIMDKHWLGMKEEKGFVILYSNP